MKTKNIIWLICLMLIVAFLSVWAIGGMTILTTKFIRVDESINKGEGLGNTFVAVYEINEKAEKNDDGAPDQAVITTESETEDIDVAKEASNAVNVFKKRIASLGYEQYNVRKQGNNKVRVEIPNISSTNGLSSLFTNNGKLEIVSGEETVFTNADVESAKFLGYDQNTSKYYVEISLNKPAKEKLKDLTGNGGYSFTVNMDNDVVSTSFSGSETVKNGKMRISFSSNDVEKGILLAYCVGSGMVKGAITENTDYQMILSPIAGENALTVFAVGVALIFVLAAVLYIVKYRLLGAIATVTTLAAFVAYDFFCATFTWLQVNMLAVAGIFVGLILIVLIHIFLLEKINAQYATGRDVISAIDHAMDDVKKPVIEFLSVGVVISFVLWICGGMIKPFGVALLGGVAISALFGTVILKHFAKTLVKAGADKESLLGLKRGE